MSIYELALFVHIVGVVVWLGGNVMLLLLSRSALAAGPDKSLEFFGMADKAANHVFPPIGILVLLSGLYMTIDVWAFSDPFISVGLATIVLALFTGIFYYSREGKQIDAVAAERGAADAEVVARIGRHTNITRFEVLLLTAVVLLMVLKP